MYKSIKMYKYILEERYFMEERHSLKNFWKKAGWLGMSILPLIGSFAIQFIIIFACVFPLAAAALFRLMQQNAMDPLVIIEAISKTLMDSIGIITLIYHIANIAVFGIWYYFGCGRRRPGRIGKILGGKVLLTSIVSGLGLCLFANAFVLLAPYVFPKAYQRYLMLMEAAGMGESIAVLIAAVVVAPIGEEIVCRGVIFHYAKKFTEGMKNRTTAFWIANIVQALMFGFLHANFIQGAYAFIIGLILGVLKEKYDSLYPAMVGHFTVNFISTFVMGYVLGLLPENIQTYVLLGILSILIVAAGLWLGMKKPKIVTE